MPNDSDSTSDNTVNTTSPVVQDGVLEHKVRMAEVYLAYLSLAIIVAAFAFAMYEQEKPPRQTVQNTSIIPTR